MEKAIALSKLFACSLDLLLESMNSDNDAYTNICVKNVATLYIICTDILPHVSCLKIFVQIVSQSAQKYAVITIKNPFIKPFTLIPNAYKTLMRYMEINNLPCKQSKEVLSCFEKEYDKDGIPYMDVSISIES